MTLLRAAMLTCIVAALFLTSMMRPPSFADDVTANDITLKHSLHQNVVIRRTSIWETGIAEKSPNTLDILMFDQELHAEIYRIKAHYSEASFSYPYCDVTETAVFVARTADHSRMTSALRIIISGNSD